MHYLGEIIRYTPSISISFIFDTFTLTKSLVNTMDDG